MLQIKSMAEVRAIAARVEFHGDDRVKAVTVRLLLKSLPLEVVDSAFVSQLSLFYRAELPQTQDFEPLHFTRGIENVRALIGNVLLPKMTCDDVHLTLLAGRRVDVDLKLKGQIERGLDDLHDFLHASVAVELTERLPELAQEAA